ncbi:hypothetical protein NXS19_005710 [Fusarium pseudograminearum]|nr:hypothetical protein NXS19_005710 [Fusarium pseudograminearum]
MGRDGVPQPGHAREDQKRWPPSLGLQKQANLSVTFKISQAGLVILSLPKILIPCGHVQIGSVFPLGQKPWRTSHPDHSWCVYILRVD